MTEVYMITDELKEKLECLYDLPFSVRTEDLSTFIYNMENEAGLKLRSSVEQGKRVVLQVVTFGFLYGYQEDTTYLHGLVKVGKGSDIVINKDAAWNVVSCGMSELTKDKKFMATHQQFKMTNMKKHFCGQYLEALNVDTFGCWDEYFGETPLYLEAVTEWDVTDYLQKVGSLKDFVEEVKNILCTVWVN